MSLAERLAGMTPADSDQYLANVWRQFANTEQFEALYMALNEIAGEANVLLLGPHTEDRARAHAAGQVTAIQRLMVTIRNAITFDPSKAVYTDYKPGDVIQGGPDNADDTQLASNAGYGVTEFSE